MRRLRWETPQRKIPRRPYRDSALVYAVLAVVVVVVAVALGGSLIRALVWAGVAFVLATGYSWWRWRQRLRQQEDEE